MVSCVTGRQIQFLMYCVLLILILGSGCVPYRGLPYLQGSEKEMAKFDIAPQNAAPYLIRVGDLLYLDFKALESSTIDAFQEPPNAGMQLQSNNAPLYLKGFTVDKAGNIDIPLIGSINIVGKSLKQAGIQVESELKKYLKYAEVRIKLANFRVTVMGEVNRPGVQYVYDERYNLLQALANAGDVTDFANRNRVKVLRETSEGVNSVYLDLMSSDFLSSPYFHLQPQDIIYVEPVKGKSFSINSRQVTVGLSVLSFIVLLLNITTR